MNLRGKNPQKRPPASRFPVLYAKLLPSFARCHVRCPELLKSLAPGILPDYSRQGNKQKNGPVNLTGPGFLVRVRNAET